MSQCPVQIHRVTDSDGSTPSTSSSGGIASCPVQSKGTTAATEATSPVSSNTPDVALLDINVDSISETPSIKEFKKLRNVMSMITKFYADGSQRKKENYDTMVAELGKLEEDENMCRDQLSAITSAFSFHPKAKEYRSSLEEELSALMAQKQSMVTKRDDFFGLYEWSKTIVEVCNWLEGNLEEYCRKSIPDLPAHLFKKPPPSVLTDAQKSDYQKGLAEITYNLQESQDFFHASVDGRLLKYHNVEKELIEAQLQVMQKYSEDSPRRQHIQGELEKDLEYVKGNMVQNPESTQRKLKMMKNHDEFFKVLRYHKDKLQALGEDTKERIYDSKYNHFN